MNQPDLERVAPVLSRSLALWIAGTALSILAVHSNYDIALAPWLFAPVLLAYAHAKPAARGIAGVAGAMLVTHIVWLCATSLIGAPAAVVAFLFLSVLMTVPFAIDRLLAPHLEGLAATLVFPAARVAMEYLFVVVAGFGSWGAIGATQHENLALVQVASITGVYGVSFLVAWFGALLHWTWAQGFRWAAIRRNVLVYSAVLGLVVAGGALRLLMFPPTSRTVRVAAINPSRVAEDASRTATREAVGRYWDPAQVAAADPARTRDAFAHINRDLIEATDREAGAGAKIVLWPETEARVLEPDLEALVQQVQAVARRRDVYVAMALALYTEQQPGVRNVTMLVTPTGELAWTYDKAHPTPMEPMKPGPGIVPVVDSPHGRLSSVICYDADYPDLMRQAAGLQADVMLIPANDWRGFEHLHAEAVVLRAVEYGYSIVRQSSHGVSTGVNRHGRIIGSVDYFTTDHPAMVVAVPLDPRAPTIYSRTGDVFAWLCLAWVGLLAAREVGRLRTPLTSLYVGAPRA